MSHNILIWGINGIDRIGLFKISVMTLWKNRQIWNGDNNISISLNGDINFDALEDALSLNVEPEAALAVGEVVALAA